jgi:type I restriction enzyme, S subunit
MCSTVGYARILERVDSLFAQIAEGEAALAAARKGLEIFRRALLKAAVTGDLSMHWRTVNPVTEIGHDILVRMAKDRGTKATRKKPGRQPAGARPLDTSALPALPQGWAWATLGEIGEIVGGATVDKKRKPANPATVPYLRVANVQRGHVDLSEVKFITVDRSAAEKLRLLPGDLLLNEGGDRDKIGRGWVWDGSIPEMIHQNHVFRVRLRDAALNPFFVSHYANQMGRRFFIEEGKQTTNLASISLSKISMLPVPIPPPAEAVEILRLVSDALTAAADTLAIFDAEAADAMRLKQSILKAAFEGRLVTQDAAEEPAGVLLGNLAHDSLKMAAGRERAGKFDV